MNLSGFFTEMANAGLGALTAYNEAAERKRMESLKIRQEQLQTDEWVRRAQAEDQIIRQRQIDKDRAETAGMEAAYMERSMEGMNVLRSNPALARLLPNVNPATAGQASIESSGVDFNGMPAAHRAMLETRQALYRQDRDEMRYNQNQQWKEQSEIRAERRVEQTEARFQAWQEQTAGGGKPSAAAQLNIEAKAGQRIVKGLLRGGVDWMEKEIARDPQMQSQVNAWRASNQKLQTEISIQLGNIKSKIDETDPGLATILPDILQIAKEKRNGRSHVPETLQLVKAYIAKKLVDDPNSKPDVEAISANIQRMIGMIASNKPFWDAKVKEYNLQTMVSRALQSHPKYRQWIEVDARNNPPKGK